VISLNIYWKISFWLQTNWNCSG